MKHLRFRLTLVVGLSLLLGLLVGRPAHAATTFTVTNCSNDSQLQAAVSTANSDNAGDIITFACSGDIPVSTTLTIAGSMTLDAGGQTVILDGQNTRPVLSVNGGVTLTLNALTIANGAGGGGGGIQNNGTLSITNSTFSENRASEGAGIWNIGTLSITNSTFSGNAADFSGGGILNLGTLSIASSTFSGNSTLPFMEQQGFGGGGICNAGGSLSVTNSTFSSNFAFGGGGILNFASSSITNSTFSHNSADGLSGSGGGIYNPSGTLSIANSTFSDNAAVAGAGIANSSALSIGGSIVANNPGGDCHLFVSLTDQGYNLESGTSCGFTGTGSRQNTDPKLDPNGLQHNGGPTQTLALEPDSPAVDQIPASACTVATDQRGVTRPQGPMCDMGAFELTAATIVNGLVSLAPVVTAFNPTPVPGGPAGTFTITATFTNTSSTSIEAPFFKVTQLSGGNLLLNADGGPGGVGARLTPDVGTDGILDPGESFTTKFVVGLQHRSGFTFLVDLWGRTGP